MKKEGNITMSRSQFENMLRLVEEDARRDEREIMIKLIELRNIVQK